jgi:hypothetical protein
MSWYRIAANMREKFEIKQHPKMYGIAAQRTACLHNQVQDELS